MAYRYLGNKTRIAEWIGDVIVERLGSGLRIADPMCGTATMSLEFARRGMAVTAADELRFPVLHARARLLHGRRYRFSPVAATYHDALRQLNGLSGVRGFFWREYSDQGAPENGVKPRAYFTGANAAKIDAIRRTISDWRTAGLSSSACDILLHDLILAANRVANIAGTYGYYRSSWNSSSLEAIELRPSATERFHRKHTVVQGKVEEVAAELDADVCYLDPPYTKRQYGGNYHILETLAQEDEPEPVGEGGLRDWYPQSSDFCSKRRVRGALHETMKRLEVPWVFLSYSEDGLVPPDEMLGLLSEYGEVSRLETPIERFRSNGGKPGPVHEHLYSVEKQ